MTQDDQRFTILLLSKDTHLAEKLEQVLPKTCSLVAKEDAVQLLDEIGETADNTKVLVLLQAEIVKRNIRIAFAQDAIVYDEKTSRGDQLVKQRARWINTWFRYFSFGFTLIGKGIRNASFNQIMFGLILLRPPLFIFLALSGICMMVNLFLSLTGLMIWLAGFACFFCGFFIALKESKAERSIYQALLHAPVFIFYQLLALMHIRRANKLSVATQHFHHGETPPNEEV